MNIENVSPPSFRGRGAKYGLILDALMKVGLRQWVAVDATEITGASTKAKQNNIHHAARYRGFRIHTTVHDGKLYVQLLEVNPYTEMSWPDRVSEEAIKWLTK